jgi:hypothetical protein
MLFAATLQGVYCTVDYGEHWIEANQGLPQACVVQSFSLKDGMIFAGTNGSGCWRRPLADIASQTVRGGENGIKDHDALKILPYDRSSSFRNIEFFLNNPARAVLRLFDLSGHEVAVLANSDFDSGRHSIKWNIRLFPAGCYIVILRIGSNMQTRVVHVSH